MSACSIAVFVYGTLKRSFWNYRKVLENAIGGGAAKFVAEALTVQRYPLILASRYRIPMALNVTDGMACHQLKGELFMVNQTFLDQLDELEGHPHLYFREEVHVMVPSNEQCTAFMYLIPPERCNTKAVALAECLEEYTPLHHEEYVPPLARPPTARAELLASISDPCAKSMVHSSQEWADFAVVVVDAQADFTDGETATLARIGELLGFARREGIDVFHVRSKRRNDQQNWPPCYVIRGKPPRCLEDTLGARVCPEAAAAEGEPIFWKGPFDVWAGEDASKIYAALQCKGHVLVCGFATSVCVLQCAIGAVNRGIVATVVKDCCGDDAPEAGELILKRYAWTLGTCSFSDVKTKVPEWKLELEQLSKVKKRRVDAT